MIMKHINQNLLFVFLGLSLGIFSCGSPKYTANFTNDPFYKAEKPTIAQENAQAPSEVIPVVTPEEITKPSEATPDDEAVASRETLITKLGKVPSIKKIVDEHKENVRELKESNLDEKSLKKEIRKEEKRAHKEVKRQLIKEIKEVKNTEDKEAMNRKVYIGIIIAAAGIVVAILASGAVGAIAIIVGVGLIAWGLIEQGSV